MQPGGCSKSSVVAVFARQWQSCVACNVAVGLGLTGLYASGHLQVLLLAVLVRAPSAACANCGVLYDTAVHFVSGELVQHRRLGATVHAEKCSHACWRVLRAEVVSCQATYSSCGSSCRGRQCVHGQLRAGGGLTSSCKLGIPCSGWQHCQHSQHAVQLRRARLCNVNSTP